MHCFVSELKELLLVEVGCSKFRLVLNNFPPSIDTNLSTTTEDDELTKNSGFDFLFDFPFLAAKRFVHSYFSQHE